VIPDTMDTKDATTSLADDLKELTLEKPVTKAALKVSPRIRCFLTKFPLPEEFYALNEF